MLWGMSLPPDWVQTSQSVEESLELRFLFFGEPYAALHDMVHQRTDLGRILHAVGIKRDDLVEGLETSVVHIGPCQGDVS